MHSTASMSSRGGGGSGSGNGISSSGGSNSEGLQRQAGWTADGGIDAAAGTWPSRHAFAGGMQPGAVTIDLPTGPLTALATQHKGGLLPTPPLYLSAQQQQQQQQQHLTPPPQQRLLQQRQQQLQQQRQQQEQWMQRMLSPSTSGRTLGAAPVSRPALPSMQKQLGVRAAPPPVASIATHGLKPQATYLDNRHTYATTSRQPMHASMQASPPHAHGWTYGAPNDPQLPPPLPQQQQQQQLRSAFSVQVAPPSIQPSAIHRSPTSRWPPAAAPLPPPSVMPSDLPLPSMMLHKARRASGLGATVSDGDVGASAQPPAMITAAAAAAAAAVDRLVLHKST
eukprot:353993-Chlamydomonas_euryale.AAC.1